MVVCFGTLPSSKVPGQQVIVLIHHQINIEGHLTILMLMLQVTMKATILQKQVRHIMLHEQKLMLEHFIYVHLGC